MSIHQISVFLENRAGQLAELTRLLADNGVDMRAISIAETADYGVMRIIADDSQKASAALLAHGAILSVTPVWAVEVPDQAGGLASLLEVLAANHVSVEYMYSLFTRITYILTSPHPSRPCLFGAVSQSYLRPCFPGCSPLLLPQIQVNSNSHVVNLFKST